MISTHIGGMVFGLILIVLGIKYKLLGYVIPGTLWFIFNFIFLKYGENAFENLISYNSQLFTILFMAIPAFVMSLVVFYNTYKYNHNFIKLLVVIVMIVDIIHIYQTNPIILFAFIFILILVRCFTKGHYDDIHQNIPLKKDYINKSEILFVIPKYKNISILEDPEYIEQIKEMGKGKTIALHGVTHTPQGYTTTAEFGIPRSKEYIMEGVEIFEKAFGYKPKFFKAPCYNLHPKNKKIINELGIKVNEIDTFLFNKLYHPTTDFALNILNHVNRIL